MYAADDYLALQPVRATLVTCLASPATLDLLQAPRDTLSLRVAADEVLLIGPPDRDAALVQAVRTWLAGVEPDALAIAMTDAWAVWSLRAPLAATALARLTAVPMPADTPPASFAQGALCGVAARILALPDRVCVLVSSTLGHHLHDRVMQLCADLRPRRETEWEFEPVRQR